MKCDGSQTVKHFTSGGKHAEEKFLEAFETIQNDLVDLQELELYMNYTPCHDSCCDKLAEFANEMHKKHTNLKFKIYAVVRYGFKVNEAFWLSKFKNLLKQGIEVAVLGPIERENLIRLLDRRVEYFDKQIEDPDIKNIIDHDFKKITSLLEVIPTCLTTEHSSVCIGGNLRGFFLHKYNPNDEVKVAHLFVYCATSNHQVYFYESYKDQETVVKNFISDFQDGQNNAFQLYFNYLPSPACCDELDTFRNDNDNYSLTIYAVAAAASRFNISTWVEQMKTLNVTACQAEIQTQLLGYLKKYDFIKGLNNDEKQYIKKCAEETTKLLSLQTVVPTSCDTIYSSICMESDLKAFFLKEYNPVAKVNVSQLFVYCVRLKQVYYYESYGKQQVTVIENFIYDLRGGKIKETSFQLYFNYLPSPACCNKLCKFFVEIWKYRWKYSWKYSGTYSLSISAVASAASRFDTDEISTWMEKMKTQKVKACQLIQLLGYLEKDDFITKLSNDKQRYIKKCAEETTKLLKTVVPVVPTSCDTRYSSICMESDLKDFFLKEYNPVAKVNVSQLFVYCVRLKQVYYYESYGKQQVTVIENFIYDLRGGKIKETSFQLYFNYLPSPACCDELYKFRNNNDNYSLTIYAVAAAESRFNTDEIWMEKMKTLNITACQAEIQTQLLGYLKKGDFIKGLSNDKQQWYIKECAEETTKLLSLQTVAHVVPTSCDTRYSSICMESSLKAFFLHEYNPVAEVNVSQLFVYCVELKQVYYYERYGKQVIVVKNFISDLQDGKIKGTSFQLYFNYLPSLDCCDKLCEFLKEHKTYSLTIYAVAAAESRFNMSTWVEKMEHLNVRACQAKIQTQLLGYLKKGDLIAKLCKREKKYIEECVKETAELLHEV